VPDGQRRRDAGGDRITHIAYLVRQSLLDIRFSLGFGRLSGEKFSGFILFIAPVSSSVS
jgi:hypothetical protein